VSHHERLEKILYLPLALAVVFFQQGEDRNKDRFKTWQLYGLWKLPFCDHRAIKLTQNCVCFTNPGINLLVPPSVTRKYHS